MGNIEIGKYGKSFGLSFAITSLFSALLVVLKEVSEPVLAWMKAVSPHHWITHTLLDLILFVVLGFALAKANNGQGITVAPDKLTSIIVGAFVVSGLIVAGFYLIVG